MRFFICAVLLLVVAFSSELPDPCSADDAGYARYDGGDVYQGTITAATFFNGRITYDYSFVEDITGTGLSGVDVFSTTPGCASEWKSGHCSLGKYVWIKWGPTDFTKGVVTDVTASEITVRYNELGFLNTAAIEDVQLCDCDDMNCVPCVDHCSCATGVETVGCLQTACMPGDQGFAQTLPAGLKSGQIALQNEPILTSRRSLATGLNSFEYLFSDGSKANPLKTKNMFSTMKYPNADNIDDCPGPWMTGHCQVGEYVWLENGSKKGVITETTATTITADFIDGSGTSGAIDIVDVVKCSCKDKDCIPCADHCSCKPGGLPDKTCTPKCDGVHDATCNAASGSNWSDEQCRCKCHTGSLECHKKCHWMCSGGCECVGPDPSLCTAKALEKNSFTDIRCQKRCNDVSNCDSRCEDKCDGCPCPDLD